MTYPIRGNDSPNGVRWNDYTKCRFEELKGLFRGECGNKDTCVEGVGFRDLTGNFLFLLTTVKIKEQWDRHEEKSQVKLIKIRRAY